MVTTAKQNHLKSDTQGRVLIPDVSPAEKYWMNVGELLDKIVVGTNAWARRRKQKAINEGKLNSKWMM